jgi:hypothetical protein
MLQAKLWVLTAKFVLAAAWVGTSAAVALETARSPLTKSAVILADVAAPAAAATQRGESDYQACQQVLQAVIDAYDNEDPTAAEAQLYFGPDADPKLVLFTPPLLEMDMEAYRVERDAVAKFGAHAMSLNYYDSTTAAMLDELLARLGPGDYRVRGDSLVIKPPAPFVSHAGAWPRAAIYFTRVGGQWKLDAGRTFKITFRLVRRVPRPNESVEQGDLYYVREFGDKFKAIAQDIEEGNITSAADLQKRMDGVIIGFSPR